MKISAEAVSRHLILASLTMTLFAVFTGMILLLLMEKAEGVFHWVLLAAAFITLFFVKRMQIKLCCPQLVQEFSGKAAHFNGIGGLRAVLFLGALLLISEVLFLFFAPQLLLYKGLSKIIAVLVAAAFAAGYAFPVRRAGKRERAWILMGIIAQIFLILFLYQITRPLPIPPAENPASQEQR